MRLIDLKPECYQIAKDNFPSDTWSLKFICPSCGEPYTICINIGVKEDREASLWAASPLPDQDPNWASRLTVSPSINNATPGHGRKHPICNFHGNIIDGAIVP